MSRKKAAPEAPKPPAAWTVTAQAARVMGQIAAADMHRAFGGLLGVADGTLVATDGHRMAWIGARPAGKMAGTIEAAPWVRAVEALAPPKRGRGENGRARLGIFSGARGASGQTLTIETDFPVPDRRGFFLKSPESFPPVAKVLETALAARDRDQVVRLNASYLADAMDFVRAMGCGSVILAIAGELDPFMVEAADGSCGMLIMPERR